MVHTQIYLVLIYSIKGKTHKCKSSKTIKVNRRKKSLPTAHNSGLHTQEWFPIYTLLLRLRLLFGVFMQKPGKTLRVADAGDISYHNIKWIFSRNASFFLLCFLICGSLDARWASVFANGLFIAPKDLTFGHKKQPWNMVKSINMFCKAVGILPQCKGINKHMSFHHMCM